MKYFKISAINNQGIYDLFENITKDIIFKMNDEDLINRSRSIKLGYNNISLFKNDENNFYEYSNINNYNKINENSNKDNKSILSKRRSSYGENESNFSNCCNAI